MATLLADRDGSAVLADLGGDQAAVLGLGEPTTPGILDWCHSEAPAEALSRLQVEVADGLSLIPQGQGPQEVALDRAAELSATLESLAESVVIDAGLPLFDPAGLAAGPASSDRPRILGAILRDQGTSVFVTRACYLSLRRAMDIGIDADGVVLVKEPGRSLGRKDVSEVLGLPIVGVVDCDPAVARAVDSGSLTRRMPNSLKAGLRYAG